MKKLFLIMSMLCISLSVFASDANRIYIGFEGGTYTYREPHMEYPIHDYGNKIGASLEWVGRSILEQSGLVEEGDNSFATFEFRYITGKVDYDGFLMNGTPYKVDGEDDYYFEGRITFGATYNLGANFELWPYLGFGYRYLVNDGTNVSDAAYRRISRYWYIPVGAKIKKDFGNNFSLTLTGEFDWFQGGEQASDLLGALDGYIYNYQSEGWGLRCGLKAEVQMSKKIGIFVEPYYRMWKIQESQLGRTENLPNIGMTGAPGIVVGGIEPFNITKEAGVRAGFYF